MNADYRWLDDPEVYAVNRLPAHSDHLFFAGEADAASGRSDLVESLDGTWSFRYLDRPGVPAEFEREMQDLAGFDEIAVPGHIEMSGYHPIHYINSDYPWEGKKWRRPAGTIPEECGNPTLFSEADDNPVGLYVRSFHCHKRCGERIHLRFLGAEKALYLWVNDSFIGYAEDSFTTSEFDITDAVRQGENQIRVALFCHSTASWLEDQDFFRFFGLFRSVQLVHIPEIHLQDVSVKSSYDPKKKTAKISADMKLLGVRENTSVYWTMKTAEGKILVSGKASVETVSGSAEIPETELGSVLAWDYREPNLYSMEISLYRGDVLAEIDRVSVGFRKLEVIDGVIYLNGHRLILCGVNRHEWSADHGRAVTGDEMQEDIQILLRNNINSVRTCHYPDHPDWYRMCDEAGIYLMAETDLEAHGSWQKYQVGVEKSWNVPSSFSRWRKAVLDRAESNYEAFKNHPSILFWSLGNESCGGDVIRDMNRYYKEKDPERLTHYESVLYTPEYRSEISDVESRMYASPEEIRKYMENHPDKPYVLCEFMHDMGNSMGGLKDYMALLDDYPGYHGGFIWDMIDQALWRMDPVTGRKVLGYGGDFDDRMSDYEFSGDGILFADRREKPAMQEVRGLYGKYLGVDSIGEVSHGSAAESHGQQCEEIVPALGLQLVFGDSALGVIGDSIRWIFSYAQGGPVSLEKDGHEWMFRAPRPAFWRATTCNDRGNGFSARSSMWMGADMFSRCREICVTRDGVDLGLPIAPMNNQLGGDQRASEIRIRYRYVTETTPAVSVDLEYHVSGSGECRVSVHYYGQQGLPELPVLGWRMTAPTAAEGYTYAGLSGETYPDRMEGGVPGIYRVEGMPVTNYMVPQECGMHMNTDWVEIRRSTWNRDGKENSPDTILRLEMVPNQLGFSCLPYTSFELENAYHQEELPPAHRTVICVAGCVRGVGGINSWGADVAEDCRISAEEDHEFSFVIR